MKEYSKKIIRALVCVWFLGVLLGSSVVVVQLIRNESVTELSNLLVYIDAPMTGGIVSYMIKSASENKEKIKRGKSEDATAQDNIDMI